MQSSKSLHYYTDLIMALTKKELKVRYKRSFLGYLWSVANPLALALVFFVAFKVIMRVQIENYTLFLIAGLFPWQWFSNSLNSSAMVFVGNASLIKKVNFRRESLVVATVLNDMLHFLLSIPIILLFVFFYDLRPGVLWLVGIPALLVIQFIITFGFSLAIAAINLFFRDIERIVFIITTLLFYITPIIYAEDMIPEQYRALLLMNPLSVLIVNWRNLFIRGTLDPHALALALFYALCVLGAGYLVFRRLRARFAEVL